MALSEPHAEIAEPFGIELKRAGLGATGWRGGIGHFARRYPLARIIDAHVEQESGRSVGNIVIEIG